MNQNFSYMSNSLSFNPPPLQGIIFDIDGVIFDSKDANIGYYNALLEVLGLPPMSEEDAEYCHMSTGNQALARIVPPALQQEALERARKLIPYHKYVTPKLRLEAGLMETLNWLMAHDIKLGICTNRFSNVPELLDFFEIGRFFSSIRTAGNSEPKPSPQGLLATLKEWELQAAQAVFIGDTEADQQAAAGASMRFWAFGNSALTAERHFDSFFSILKALPPLVE